MHCACVSIQEMQVSDVSDVTFTETVVPSDALSWLHIHIPSE